MLKRTSYIIIALLVAILSGCASTPKQEAEPMLMTQRPVDLNAPPQQTIEYNNSDVATVTVQPKPAEMLPKELVSADSKLYEKSVYFELDSFRINGDGKNTINEHANYLNQKRNYKIMLQGNADERGSSEYNLALGQKRAEAVKNVMQLLGVSDDRIEAVSFGKEKPRNPGHDEAAWAENRRVDIVYGGGN